MNNYSKYFGQLTKTHGIPQLTEDQFLRMMNIVYLEGMQARIQCVRTKLKANQEIHEFDMQVFWVGKKLTGLTGNLKPTILMQEMLSRSAKKPLEGGFFIYHQEDSFST